MNKYIASIVVILICIWLALSLYPRAVAEHENRNIEIAVNLKRVYEVADFNNYPSSDFIDRLKSNGVTTLIVEEETADSLRSKGDMLGFSSEEHQKLLLLDSITSGSAIKANTIILSDSRIAEYLSSLMLERYSYKLRERKIGRKTLLYLPPTASIENLFFGFPYSFEALKDHGFLLALKPTNSGSPSWLYKHIDETVSSIILGAPERFYKNRKNFISSVTMRINYIDFEFATLPDRMYANPRSIIRAHRISEQEIASMSSSAVISRYLRGIRERGMRFIEIGLDEKSGIEGNLDLIKDISRRIRKSGFVLSKCQPPRFAVLPHMELRRVLTLFMAAFIPSLITYFALKLTKKNSGYLLNYFYVNAMIITSGVFLASFISSLEFQLKLYEINGIKFIMISSFLFSVLALFSATEIRRFLNFRPSVGFLCSAALGAFVAWVIIIRTGNVNFSWDYELRLRELLERIFYIRPRWKEILLGQPFLLLGLKTKNKVALLLGAVASISVVNTFLHAHSPIVVSIYRTVLGAILGGLAGFLISSFIKLNPSVSDNKTQ